MKCEEKPKAPQTSFLILLGILLIIVWHCSKNNNGSTSNNDVVDKISDKYEINSMLILCNNYFKNEIAVYSGSNLHIYTGHHSTIERKDDIRLLIDGTAINEYGAKRQIQVACYVSKEHKTNDYMKYSNVTLFESFVD